MSLLLTLYIIFSVLVLFMTMRILVKTGTDPWWALVSIVPGVNIVCLWVLALSEWKTVPRR